MSVSSFNSFSINMAVNKNSCAILKVVVVIYITSLCFGCLAPYFNKQTVGDGKISSEKYLVSLSFPGEYGVGSGSVRSDVLPDICKKYFLEKAVSSGFGEISANISINLLPVGDKYILTVSSDEASRRIVRKVLSKNLDADQKINVRYKAAYFTLDASASKDVREKTGIDLDPVTGPYILSANEARNLMHEIKSHPKGKVMPELEIETTLNKDGSKINAKEIEYKTDFRPGKETNTSVLIGGMAIILPKQIINRRFIYLVGTPEWTRIVKMISFGAAEIPVVEFIRSTSFLFLEPNKNMLLRLSSQKSVETNVNAFADYNLSFMLVSGTYSRMDPFSINLEYIEQSDLEMLRNACGDEADIMYYWGPIEKYDDEYKKAATNLIIGLTTNNIDYDVHTKEAWVKGGVELISHIPDVIMNLSNYCQVKMGWKLISIDIEDMNNCAYKTGVALPSDGMPFVLDKEKAREFIDNLQAAKTGQSLVQCGFVSENNSEGDSTSVYELDYPTKYEKIAPGKKSTNMVNDAGYDMASCCIGATFDAMPSFSAYGCSGDDIALYYDCLYTSLIRWSFLGGHKYPMVEHLQLSSMPIIGYDSVLVLQLKKSNEKKHNIDIPMPAGRLQTNNSEICLAFLSASKEFVKQEDEKTNQLEEVVFSCDLSLCEKNELMDSSSNNVSKESNPPQKFNMEAVRKYLKSKGAELHGEAKVWENLFVVKDTKGNIDHIRNILKENNLLRKQPMFTCTFLELGESDASTLKMLAVNDNTEIRFASWAFYNNLLKQIQTSSVSEVSGTLPIAGYDGFALHSFEYRCSDVEMLASCKTTNIEEALYFPENHVLRNKGGPFVEFGRWFKVNCDKEESLSTVNIESAMILAGEMKPDSIPIPIRWKAKTSFPFRDGDIAIVPLDTNDNHDKKKQMYVAIAMRMISGYCEKK